jgi:hypothetical protein
LACGRSGRVQFADQWLGRSERFDAEEGLKVKAKPTP